VFDVDPQVKTELAQMLDDGFHYGGIVTAVADK